MYEFMFDEGLIDIENKSSTEDELFESVASVAHSKGYVRSDYKQGLQLRENKFPTGLIFPKLNLALPHVDPEFVLKPFIYVVRTNSEIPWRQMGDMQQMTTRNFLFLGIKEPSQQVGLLAQLMSAFKDSTFVSAFLKANTPEQMYSLLSDHFSKVSAH